MSHGKRNLHLVGMPGAGKSTVGKVLARQLALTFIDADHEMVEHTGVSIATIFELEGEGGFRQRETQLITDLCKRDGLLLATGGGAVLREENRVALRQSGVVIYLHAGLDHLWQRTRHDSRRPLLQTENPRAALRSLLDVRDPLYRQTADLIVETGRQSVNKLVSEIMLELTRRQLWPIAPADASAQTNETRP
ncbi:MAG: shikimate kinase [Betaproteobacteria bacterium]|nr:shikimate kinase [Betaproteobacteria bacterium]